MALSGIITPFVDAIACLSRTPSYCDIVLFEPGQYQRAILACHCHVCSLCNCAIVS